MLPRSHTSAVVNVQQTPEADECEKGQEAGNPFFLVFTPLTYSIITCTNV